MARSEVLCKDIEGIIHLDSSQLGWFPSATWLGRCKAWQGQAHSTFGGRWAMVGLLKRFETIGVISHAIDGKFLKTNHLGWIKPL